jgi:hypothetical protein
MKFANLHDFDVHTVYHATNEEPALHTQLLTTVSKKRFQKAASICSGGEIPFFVLLPRCQEVFAVDHSKAVIALAMSKMLILEKLGPKALHQLLLEDRRAKYEDLLLEVKKDLPEDLRTCNTSLGSYKWPEVRREWGLISPATLAKALKHKDRLTFIHGDITDLAQFGPFDIVYLSNALEHMGRTGKAPVLTDIPMTEGCIMLHTGSASLNQWKGSNVGGPWDELAKYQGLRTSWAHRLARLVPQVQAAAVAAAA